MFEGPLGGGKLDEQSSGQTVTHFCHFLSLLAVCVSDAVEALQINIVSNYLWFYILTQEYIVDNWLMFLPMDFSFYCIYFSG